MFKDHDSDMQGAVCGEWVWDKYMTQAFKLAISVSINVVNTVLKFILIRVIAFIGEDQKSAQSRSIKVGVFFT